MRPDPELSLPPPETAALWAKAASRTALVAVLFSAVLVIMLLGNAQLIRRTHPLDHPDLITLNTQLAQADQARDQAGAARLTEQIREVDRRLRQQYLHARAVQRQGAWLLVAGLAAFFLAAKVAWQLRRQLPMPGTDPGLAAALVQPAARRAVIAVLLVLVVVLLVTAYLTPAAPWPAVPK